MKLFEAAARGPVARARAAFGLVFSASMNRCGDKPKCISGHFYVTQGHCGFGGRFYSFGPQISPQTLMLFSHGNHWIVRSINRLA